MTEQPVKEVLEAPVPQVPQPKEFWFQNQSTEAVLVIKALTVQDAIKELQTRKKRSMEKGHIWRRLL